MCADRKAWLKARFDVLWLGLFAAMLIWPAGTGHAARVKTFNVLCSTFPMFEFTRNVAAGREGVDVSVMLPPDMGCPHDYALTPRDMEKLARADVFVANGLGLEEFLGEPVKRANARLAVIDTSEGLADLLPGGERNAKNPHLFASPRMAAQIVRNIGEGLARIDSDGAALYRANAAAYAAKLDRLADEFAACGKKLRMRKIVTAHAVFDYLARDMGLEIVAVVEESPGQEPAAADMLRIIEAIKTRGAAAVFVEPQYPRRVAETIAKEADVPVALLDPVAGGPDAAPLDYYETVMRKNLEALKKTLGYEGP